MSTQAHEAQPGNGSTLPTALACVIIIARQLGLDVTAEQIVRDNARSDGLIATDELRGFARRAGLQSKVLHIGFDDLSGAEQFLPAIARFNDGSCMVLLAVRRDSDIPSVVLQDPHADADTPLVIDRVRFAQAWTGDLILVRRRAKADGPVRRFGWPLIAQVASRERPLVRDVVLGTIALSLIAIVPVLFVQLLVQRVFTYSVSSTFTILSLAFLVAVGAETALGSMRRFLLARLMARVEAKLSTELLDRLLTLPLTAVQAMSRGAVTQKVDQLARLRAPATNDVLGAILDLGLLVFFLPLMAYFSPLLTTLTVVAGALVAWGLVRVLPRFRTAIAAADAAAERRAAFQSEVIAGIKTVKALSLDVGQRQHWRRLSDDVAEQRVGAGRLAAFLQAVATPVERLLVAGTLAIGVYLSVTGGGAVAVGVLIAFYLLVQRLAAPLLGLSRLVLHAEAVRVTVETLAGLVSRPADDARSSAGAAGPLRGHIAFADVGFRYVGAARPVLRGVTFDCPPGTILGIMGRSGSGKSTITRLLQRLHGEHRGAITIDGRDIRDYDPAYLRRAIGVVGQDSFIFSGTIRENITAARVSATFEEVTTAARLAGADEFIDTLPRGFETMVQEGAPSLSTGQRQRLALARAFITNPRILVLDEALSALDGEIEMRVLATLRGMARERTIILVSHRLSALMAADTVLVMEDGQVHDLGPHHVLLERSDLYSHQWHRERVQPDSDPQTDRLLALS